MAKMTESDLNRIVNKVISEQGVVGQIAKTIRQVNTPQTPSVTQTAPAPLPSCSQFKKFVGEGIDTNIGSYFYPKFDASGGMVLYGETKVTGVSDKGQKVQVVKDQPFCKC